MFILLNMLEGIAGGNIKYNDDIINFIYNCYYYRRYCSCDIPHLDAEICDSELSRDHIRYSNLWK